MKKYLTTVLLLLGLVVGFTGGYFFKDYQLNKLRGNLRNGMGTANGQRFVPNNGQTNVQNKGMSAGGVEGEIISQDDKSITIKISDGSTKIILFSESTSYLINSPSKKENLKSGVKVSVFGKTNSDGSLTADRIQLNTTNTEK